MDSIAPKESEVKGGLRLENAMKQLALDHVFSRCPPIPGPTSPRASWAQIFAEFTAWREDFDRRYNEHLLVTRRHYAEVS